MDNDFYNHKAYLLEKLSNLLAEVDETMVQLRFHERNADDPDPEFLSDTDFFVKQLTGMDEWVGDVYTSVSPMVEYNTKKV